MDKIQITISNKTMISQQIRQTARIILSELLPFTDAQGDSLLNLEMNKLLQQNMSQIEILNKQLDKLQKYLRVRNELINVLSSINQCQMMHKDMLEILQLYQTADAGNILQILDHQSAVAFLKKIKVY